MTSGQALKSSRLDLPISGMSCAACARAIQSSLVSTEGVKDARVNFATSTATVEYDQSQIDRDAIVATIRDVGYDVKEDTGDASLVNRLLIAAAGALVTMPLGMLHRAISLQAICTFPVMLYAALPFFRDAWTALRHRQANMNTLIALGSGTAFLYSLLEWSRGRHDVYFEAACVIVAMILLGRFLESGARRKASESIRLLIDLRPQTARVERAGSVVEVAASDLVPGDTVVVRPGERLPCDGVVFEGKSSVNESMLTGESMPVEKTAGSPVFRGTMNGFGSLRVEAQKVGTDTALDRIIELVAQAQNSRAPIARLADTVSGYFTLIVLGIALVTAGVWLVFAPSLALPNAVAVLIVACPCALGLATPAAIVAGIGRGAQRGILIKSGEALEAAGRVDTVVLDKTGTLTAGRPEVERILPADGYQQEDVLRWAAAAEKDSEHPLALAIRTRASSLNDIPRASQFQATAGWGVSAMVNGFKVTVHRAEMDSDTRDDLAGLTVAEVSVDGKVIGQIGIGDQLRPEAHEAVEALQSAGYEVWMLTGDRQEVADRIASDLGIANYVGALLPEEKVGEMGRIRARGRHLAMAGDGINDAPALASADVGIAMGGASDIAAEAGGISLLRSDLLLIPESLRLARRTMQVIRQNLFWAFGYNILALPLAAGALYPAKGWLLSPMIASAAMAFSSLSVVLNSLRLRRA